MADDLSKLIWLPPRTGTCGEAGPWGTRCTENPTHDYAHYDAGDDSSWTTDVMEDFLDDHPEVTPPSDYERRRKHESPDLMVRNPIDTGPDVEPWFRAESDQWNALIRTWAKRLQTEGLDDDTQNALLNDFRTIVGTDQDTLEGFAMHLLLSLAAHVPHDKLSFP